MEIVSNIFEEYKDWILLINDNMLILAHTSEELFEKIKLIIRLCFKHNLLLKMEKSMLGIHKVKFFGYECEKNKFRIYKTYHHQSHARECRASWVLWSYARVSCYRLVQHDNSNI